MTEVMKEWILIFEVIFWSTMMLTVAIMLWDEA